MKAMRDAIAGRKGFRSKKLKRGEDVKFLLMPEMHKEIQDKANFHCPKYDVHLFFLHSFQCRSCL